MVIERLTQKAKDIIVKASTKDELTAKQILKYITESEGMGKHLIEAVPPISIKKTKKFILEDLVKEAFLQSIKLEHTYVGTEHFYLALLKLNNSKQIDQVKIELIKLGVFPNTIKQPIEKAKKTPMLDSFGEDLNHMVLRGYLYPIVYRTEYEKLISTLLLKEKFNALLVGDEGVGKHTIIKLLAHNINSLEVPPMLVGFHLRSLNLLSFMTSIASKGGIDYGILTLVEELKSLNRVILVLEGFEDIFFSTSAGLSIPIFFSILKSNLDEIGISMITYLTPGMYEKIVAENEHIINNFTVIEVEEPSPQEVKEILKVNALKLESFHNVTITDDVLIYVYEKALKEIKSTKFPQKAIDLLDYACAYVITKRSKIPNTYKDLVDKSFEMASQLDTKIEGGDYDEAIKISNKIHKIEVSLNDKEKKIFNKNKKLNLTKKDIDKVLKQINGETADTQDSKSITKFSKLYDKMKKEIIGQDEAVDIVSKALVRSRLGLRSKKRPLGNFLFLGPTGVGKTELAKILAKNVFQKDEWTGLIRLDMSDFSEKHTVARLVGAPPGYVGYGEGGELTSKIELHPNSVVLFDEIEKAHPDVLNILLQIMEEGELADAKGTVFDFSKSVVILTSNLGTEILQSRGIGFEEKELQDKNIEKRLKENLKGILKPELLNRFDEIVVFKRLTKKDQMDILNLLLVEVNEALENQQVYLKIGVAIKRKLLEIGYSKEYGARALRRTIEKELLDKVAQVLLEKEERPLQLTSIIDRGSIVIK